MEIKKDFINKYLLNSNLNSGGLCIEIGERAKHNTDNIEEENVDDGTLSFYE